MLLSTATTAAYLRRLRVDDPGPPSAEALRALHAAHVERIPYEVIEIQLSRPTTIDPHDSAARILDRHRGGSCYHLNGALSLLLESLGYDVVWHCAGVQNHADPGPPGAQRANHLALTVHGLPAEQSPSGDWLVDCGLGDALHEPLPLHEGSYSRARSNSGCARRRSSPAAGAWTTTRSAASPAWTSAPSARRRATSSPATSTSRRRRSRASCAAARSSAATRAGSTRSPAASCAASATPRRAVGARMRRERRLP